MQKESAQQMKIGGAIKRAVIWSVATALLFIGLVSAARAVVMVGQPVSVDVSISNVTDLYAFQFSAGFNQNVLSGTGVREGPFLPSGGPTFFIPGTIDNTAGTISLTADTLIGVVPGVSGSGTLAILDFTAVGVGASPISLTDVVLLNSRLQEISAAVEAESVTVAPEPTSLAIFFAGIIGFLWLRFRRVRWDGEAER
jgi:hypothetical protein